MTPHCFTRVLAAALLGLVAVAEEARADLGDVFTGRSGGGVRPPGRID
jgi:hypothetical protein